MAAIPAMTPFMDNKKEHIKILHQVFFWLHNPGSKADTEQLIEGLKTLKAIAEVNNLLIGKPASTIKRDVVDNSFDVSELIHFKSVKDQDAYQVHPVHKAFVEKYGHLWKTVKVFDSEIL